MLYLNGKAVDWSKDSGDAKGKFVRDKIFQYLAKYSNSTSRDLSDALVSFVWTSAFEYPDPDNPGKFKKKTFLTIPCLTTVKTNQGLEEWRYVERVDKNEHGQNTYAPAFIEFNGRKTLGRPDADMLFYLLYCCPLVAESENTTGINKYIKVRNPRKDAAEKVNMERDISEAKAIIYNWDKHLKSDAKLRELAKAMGVQGLEAMDNNEVSVALERVATQTRYSLTKFFEVHRSDDKAALLSLINECKEFGVLRLIKNSWRLMTPEGKVFADFVDVAPSADAVETLIKYVSNNPAQLELLKKEARLIKADKFGIVEKEAEIPVVIDDEKPVKTKK